MTYSRTMTETVNGPTSIKMHGPVNFEVVLTRRKDLVVVLTTQADQGTDTARCMDESYLKRVGDGFELKVKVPTHSFSFNNGDVYMNGTRMTSQHPITAVVYAPEMSWLEAESRGGGLAVSGDAGKITASLHGGGLLFNGASELDVVTHGGNVYGTYVAGLARVNGSGGHISLLGVRGDMELKTSGGNITVESAHGNGYMKTSGGNLHLGKFAGKSMEMLTSGGNISHPDSKGIIARTSGGRVNGRSSW